MTSEYSLLNLSIYMPTDDFYLIKYKECLNEISADKESSMVNLVFVLGDFNSRPDELLFF